MEIQQKKQELRTQLLEKRRSISKEEREKKEEILCQSISSLPCLVNADTVLLYSPVRCEPNLLSLAKTALKMGKTVAFPRSDTDSYTLSFGCVSSFSELALGAYSILEPPKDAKEPSLTPSTLCIVPALALDVQGFRLGYGKGFYDRFLSNFQGVTLGAVFDGFVLPSLPRLDTDIPLDIVITETGVLKHYEIPKTKKGGSGRA